MDMEGNGAVVSCGGKRNMLCYCYHQEMAVALLCSHKMESLFITIHQVGPLHLFILYEPDL